MKNTLAYSIGAGVGGLILLIVGIAVILFKKKQRLSEVPSDDVEMKPAANSQTSQYGAVSLNNSEKNTTRSELDAHWEIDFTEIRLGKEIGHGV